MVVVAIVAGLLWIASANVQVGRGEHERGAGRGGAASSEPRRSGRRVGQETNSLHIHGSMTLGEVAQGAGVPLAALRAQLELPEDTLPDARLGHLRRDYGLELSAVREAVRRLREERRTQP